MVEPLLQYVNLRCLPFARACAYNRGNRTKEEFQMLNENIRNLRKQKGYSQETLAQELNVVRQTVSKWEKGYSVPDAVMLERIAEVLEVSVSDLLGEETRPEPKPDLSQIAAQLTILNDQYAREQARRQKIRKIKMAFFIPVLALFIGSIVFIFVSMDTSCYGADVLSYGDVVGVETRYVESEIFTQEEIASAYDAVKDYFHNEFEACTMTKLYYGGDELSQAETDEGDGTVMVLLSSFYTLEEGGDGSFAANATYDNWKWMLIKEADGTWKVINYGYC